MALAFVQDAANSTWTNNFQVTSSALGAAPTNGNVLWAFLWTCCTANPTITPPSGWTSLNEGDDGVSHVAVFYKVAGGSEPTQYTWTWVNSEGVVAIYVAEWSGNDTTTPIDVSAGAWVQWGSNPASPLAIASITTVTNGAVHLIVVNNKDKNTGQFSAPSGYTMNENSTSIGTFSKTIATAGATGTVNVSIAGTFEYYSYEFALRPSGGGGGPTVTYPQLERGIRGLARGVAGGLARRAQPCQAA